MANRIDRRDIDDTDLVDSVELASSGSGTPYKEFVSIVSTTQANGQVVVTGWNIVNGDDDDYVEAGDIFFMSGSTPAQPAASGSWTIVSVIDLSTFVVSPSISTSTGGTGMFIHPVGATRVGYNPSGSSFITSYTLQSALSQLDTTVLAISSSLGSAGLSATAHKTLRQLTHLAEGGGPWDGFTSGAYRETTGGAFPSSVIWYTNSGKTAKIVEKTITRLSNQSPSTIVWKAYDTDGTTVLVTLTETITYSADNMIETSRARTWV